MRFRPNRSLATLAMACLSLVSLVPFLLDSAAAPFPSVSKPPDHSLLSNSFPKSFPRAPQASASSMMQMPMVFPLFLQNQDFTSTLVLTNAAAQSTYADLVLKTTTGTEITHQRVEFTAHSQRTIDVQYLLMSAVSPATTGSITVIQQSPELDGTMVILGQLSLTYRASGQPNYIDEEIGMPSAQGSQTLRAVADPGEGSPLVSITNLSESGQRIAIQCLAAHGKGISKTVDLLKGETLLTEACSQRTVHGAVIESLSEAESEAEGNESEGLRGPIGISLTTDGMPGTLAAFGLRRHKNNDKESFSAVTFTDPKMLNSSTTIFAGVPVGPASLLQEGKYVPELSLANFSAKDLKIHAEYTQTSGAAPTTNEIAALTLPAGTSRSLKFDSLQGDSQLQNSFLVTSNGSPGDLMAKLVSRSDSSPASVELLGKDAQDSNNGGSNPWSIEQGTESTLLFFNHDKAAQIFNVLIASADGSQWDKDFKLAPMETMAISIGDIVQKQMKDEKGKTLPKTAVSGQISWWTVGTASGPGTGRLVQSNRASRMARSFACGCPYILCGAIFTQDVSSMLVGDTAAPLDELTPQICMYRVNSHCSGIPGSYFSSQALTYNWYSSNTAVLQVSGSSTNSYVNGYGADGGTATMTGEVSATYFGPPETCTFYGSAQTKVQKPTSITASIGSLVTYNGNHMIECDGTDDGARWGYSRCVTYTLKDQNGSTITGGNFTAQESFQYVSSNPSNIKSNNANNNLAADGTFKDFLAFVAVAPPPPQPGQFIKEKQFFTIVNNKNQKSYANLRINCLDFESNDVTITDITNGGTCQ